MALPSVSWRHVLVLLAVLTTANAAQAQRAPVAQAPDSSRQPAWWSHEQAALQAELDLDPDRAFSEGSLAWAAACRVGAWPEATALLAELEEIARAQGRFPALARLLVSLPPTAPPWFACEVRHVRTEAWLHAGDLAQAERSASAQAWITRWAICGPFDNERDRGFETAYAPERPGPPDWTARFEGKGRQVGWRLDPPPAHLGRVELDALFYPNDEAVAYALTYLRHDGPQPVALRLWLGSDEGLRVWCNDELVLSHRCNRRWAPDQDVVTVVLRPGWNKLLLKVTEREGDWAFSARLTDADGSPVSMPAATPEQLRAGPPTTPTAAAHTRPSLPPAPGAIPILQRRLASGRARARDAFHLGVLLARRHAHDENEHPDREAYARACELAPDNVAFRLRHARSLLPRSGARVERDPNPMRQELEALLADHPRTAAAHLLLARYALERQFEYDRAQRHLEQAAALAPDSADVALLGIRLARARRRRVEPWVRLGRLHAMAKRPLPPAALVELGRAARAHLRLAEASALARRALERDALFRPAVSLLVGLAVARGDLDAALGPLDRWRQLRPFDLAATRRRAELLRVHGRLDRALATVAAARRIRPDDPEWMEREGHILLELGRTDEAIARFEQALRIDAQRPALRRYLELLRTEAPRFEDDWRLPLEPALAAADNIPLDPTVAVRVLLDHHVIRVGRDGRRSHFLQQVLRIENDDGLQRLDRVAVPYAVGEQEVRFDKAWIVKPDGRRLRAPIRSQTHRASRRSRDEEPRTSRFTVDLPPAEVGDRVVLEYRVDDTATSFFGDYFGHRHTFDGPDPVLRSRLVLLTPRGRTIHTHARPGSIRCQSSVSPDGKWDVRIWEQRDLARIEPEPDMPPVREIGRSVEISTFRDWNDFARWYWNLIRKQYVISPELHAKVQELTRGLSSREERIAAIYAFVAQKIRYNDKWEFGVHGFKPYKASSIFARRFGDCKDKALLINTMLSDLGIPSYPVLIRAERRRAHDDLALPMVEHFNHCIAFVPGPGPHGQDGWFLDGTAQYHAPTSLPGMDAGARVVVIGPEGAELRRVPVPVPLRDNGLRESRRLELAPDRSAEMTVELRASGDAAATLREMLAQPGQRAERLRRLYGEVAPGAEVLEVRTSPLSDLRQPVRIHYRLRIPHALEPGGEDLVLKSLGNPLGRWLYAERLGSFATSRTRRHDVLLPPPFGVEEEIEVHLPPGLAVQTLPADRTLHCPEGRYERRSRLRDGVVHMQRRLEIGAQRVPTADYPRWRRFAVDVDRADAERLRLQREETRD